jgi:hypothetical protein
VKPKVLIATTSRWVPTARMSMALANAGCTVEAVCPPRHPLGKTNVVRQTHTYHGLAPLRSFMSAIVATSPDLVVPGDDLATRHLHDLHSRGEREGNAGLPVCALIERSLGAAENFPVIFARSAFMEVAHQEGIRVPNTGVIENIDDLRRLSGCLGFPMVLKANGTSGGDGVRVAQTLEEAERALRTLQAPPLFARAAKRALVDQDTTLLWPSLLRRRFVVNAQAFVTGREATSTTFCWQGTVLASLHFEVVNKTSSTGHATMVRLIENAEMSGAVEKMARRLSLSGLYGFDFMVEADTGAAHLIEINPRTTQVGHLSLGPGRDISAALYAALSGKPVQPAPKVTEKDTIALFPQEWIRDSASPFLRSAYHDIPWEEPELIRDCVSNRRKQSAWYSRSDRKQVSSVALSPKPITAPTKSRTVGLDWGGK